MVKSFTSSSLLLGMAMWLVVPALSAQQITDRAAAVATRMQSASAFAVENGESTIALTRKCRSYIYQFGMILPANNAGSVASLVTDSQGNVKLENPISEMKCDAANVTLENGRMTVPVPQVVSHVTMDEEGTAVTYNICLAAFKEVEVEEYSTTWTVTGDTSITFDSDGNGTYTQTSPTTMIGLGVDLGAEGIQWLGYGDVNITFAPMTDEVVAIPNGLVTDNYVVNTMESPHIARVGFNGNDVYVQGLIAEMPEAWVKGRIDGENAIFDNCQYLGIAHAANMYNNYTYCMITTETYDEDFYPVYADPSPTFSVAYDANNKSLTFSTDHLVCLSLDPESVYYIRSAMRNVSLQFRGGFEPTTPPDPVIESFSDYDPENGYGEIDFTMPDSGADGKILDFTKYFYNIIVDGELYTVTPEVHSSVKTPMTNIPYNFTDEDDFYNYAGGYHMYYFRIPQFQTIAIQSIYIVDGVENKSAVVVAGTSGVENVSQDKSPAATEYFDLYGRKINHPANGIFIRRVTHNDGSVTTDKIAIR